MLKVDLSNFYKLDVLWIRLQDCSLLRSIVLSWDTRKLTLSKNIKMPKKFNKKSPCPYCDSGKSYEKCCRKKILLYKQVKLEVERQEQIIQSFTDKYGHVQIPSRVNAYGKKLISVGSEILEQTRLGDYNFTNLIHDYALKFLGEKYLKQQTSIALEKRHPVIQWMYAFLSGSQVGGGAAWIRFAYDIYTIGADAKLKQKMRDRLLKQHSFQGKRHELWVAALFITAGFEIEFIDEEASEDKEPEFLATDKQTKEIIAVEAKSKQRKGVLGFSDGIDRNQSENVGIIKLLKKAYRKEKGIPLCVVVDTNLPPETSNINFECWSKQIEQTMEELTRNGYEDPCRANIVLIYNDPSHYLTNESIGQEKDNIWVMSHISKTPKNSCKDVNHYKERLFKAQRQRLYPPTEIPNIQ
jgi:hypothetical protein